MKRLGRNDKCKCGSGKKYKICCLEKDEKKQQEDIEKYTKGQEESSENVEMCMEYLKEDYGDHNVIDITNNLNNNTYRPYQLTNYQRKIIMIAERTDKNAEVFDPRGGPDNDIIVMYRGSYRTFRIDQLEQVSGSIDKMIKTRLAGKDDV